MGGDGNVRPLLGADDTDSVISDVGDPRDEHEDNNEDEWGEGEHAQPVASALPSGGLDSRCQARCPHDPDLSGVTCQRKSDGRMQRMDLFDEERVDEEFGDGVEDDAADDAEGARRLPQRKASAIDQNGS